MTSTPIVVPQLGNEITEAEITEWLKSPGDAVAQDEPVVIITTTKMSIEIEAPVAGVLGEILVVEGDLATAGTQLASIETPMSGAGDADDPARVDGAPAARLYPLGGNEAGAPVVLIHGFGADRYAWPTTAAPLFAAHRVYALELAGHGDAGAIVDPRIDALARDALAALAALAPPAPSPAPSPALAAPPVALIGHSLGGAAALSMAAQAPGLAARIVVIAPAGYGGAVDASFLDALPELETVEAARALLQRLVVRPRLINVAMAQHLVDGLRRPGRREGLRALAARLRALDPAAMAETAARAAAHAEIAWIWGADDAINPVKPDAPPPGGGRLHLIPDSGHMPHVESAAKVNRIIAAALAQP